MKWCNPGELCQFIGITKTFDITNLCKNLNCCNDIYTGNSCKRAAKIFSQVLVEHLLWLTGTSSLRKSSTDLPLRYFLDG